MQDSWKDFNREIDQRLSEIRPARAGANEKDWREPVYGWARNHIPDESNLVRHFAIERVDRREGEATKHANKYLRQWLHGQLVLSWEILGPLPIKVDGIRVRLDAATPDDVETAAWQLAAAGKATFDEVMLLSQGLADIARNARRAGYTAVAQLGDLPPPEQASGNSSDDDEEEDDEPF